MMTEYELRLAERLFKNNKNVAQGSVVAAILIRRLPEPKRYDWYNDWWQALRLKALFYCYDHLQQNDAGGRVGRVRTFLMNRDESQDSGQLRQQLADKAGRMQIGEPNSEAED